MGVEAASLCLSCIGLHDRKDDSSVYFRPHVEHVSPCLDRERGAHWCSIMLHTSCMCNKGCAHSSRECSKGEHRCHFSCLESWLRLDMFFPHVFSTPTRKSHATNGFSFMSTFSGHRTYMCRRCRIVAFIYTQPHFCYLLCSCMGSLDVLCLVLQYPISLSHSAVNLEGTRACISLMCKKHHRRNHAAERRQPVHRVCVGPGQVYCTLGAQALAEGRTSLMSQRYRNHTHPSGPRYPTARILRQGSTYLLNTTVAALKTRNRYQF